MNDQEGNKRYYKYVDSYGIDILRSLRLKVANFSLTNDPFEILPRIDYPTDPAFWHKQFDSQPGVNLLKQMNPPEYARQRDQFTRRSIALRPEALRELPRRLRDGYAKKVGFICLTTKPNDIAMWAHYANCHMGLVVEFDAGHKFFLNATDKQGKIQRIFPVEYRDSRPFLKFGDVFEMKLLACKGKVWAYENEVRMIFHHDYCNKEGNNRYSPIPAECITGVIIGSRASDDVTEEINKLNNENWNGKLVVRKADEDPEEYRINIPD